MLPCEPVVVFDRISCTPSPSKPTRSPVNKMPVLENEPPPPSLAEVWPEYLKEVLSLLAVFLLMTISLFLGFLPS